MTDLVCMEISNTLQIRKGPKTVQEVTVYSNTQCIWVVNAELNVCLHVTSRGFHQGK